MYLPWQNLVAVLLLQKARILLRALPHLLLLALKSKSRQARAAFVIPCSLTRCHKSRVITDAQYDLRDGTWVYSTTDKTVHNRTKAKSALLHNWNRFQHYCCKLSHCRLCHEYRDLVGPSSCWMLSKLYRTPTVATRRSFTKF